MIHQNRD